MKTLTINIPDQVHARLASLAGIVGLTPEQFLETEGIERIVVDSTEGNIADLLVSGVWDSLETAQAAAVKADEADESAYFWHFYRTPEGKVLAECSDQFCEQIEAKGNTLIVRSPSQDWKEAA